MRPAGDANIRFASSVFPSHCLPSTAHDLPTAHQHVALFQATVATHAATTRQIIFAFSVTSRKPAAPMRSPKDHPSHATRLCAKRWQKPPHFAPPLRGEFRPNGSPILAFAHQSAPLSSPLATRSAHQQVAPPPPQSRLPGVSEFGAAVSSRRVPPNTPPHNLPQPALRTTRLRISNSSCPSASPQIQSPPSKSRKSKV